MKVLTIFGEELTIPVENVFYFGYLRKRKFIFWHEWRICVVLRNGKKIWTQDGLDEISRKYLQHMNYAVKRAAYVIRAGSV